MSATVLPMLTHGEQFTINQNDGTLITATWDATRSVWMLHKLDFVHSTCESAEINYCHCRELAGVLRVMKLEWK